MIEPTEIRKVNTSVNNLVELYNNQPMLNLQGEFTSNLNAALKELLAISNTTKAYIKNNPNKVAKKRNAVNVVEVFTSLINSARNINTSLSSAITENQVIKLENIQQQQEIINLQVEVQKLKQQLKF